MSDDVGSLSPDEAFQTIGNEIRLEILLVLAEDGPQSFSELFDRVEVSDSGQFNYHLDQLTDHFIRKADEGYQLQETGRRVIEAIYSGVITELPTAERYELDRACWRCGAPIEINCRPGSVEFFCTDCPGTYGRMSRDGSVESAETGYLGRLFFPPAGFQDRNPDEVYRAAQIWGGLESFHLAKRICPRCAGKLDYALHACEDHDATDDLCGVCAREDQVMYYVDCINCTFEATGHSGVFLQTHPDVLALQIANGADPIEQENVSAAKDWEILATEPFHGRCTYTFAGDELVLEVDADLNIQTVSAPDAIAFHERSDGNTSR